MVSIKLPEREHGQRHNTAAQQASAERHREHQ
jgi:hypothetical protein